MTTEAASNVPPHPLLVLPLGAWRADDASSQRLPLPEVLLRIRGVLVITPRHIVAFVDSLPRTYDEAGDCARPRAGRLAGGKGAQCGERGVKPIAIDLFCGLGGWAEGFLAEGYDVVGFDIERHRYPRREFAVEVESQKSMHGKDRHGNTLINRALEQIHGFHRAPFTGEWDEYPGQLVLQDALTLHGSQFRNAACIVASPPCQEYSYMAMPWKRAKQIAAALRAPHVYQFPDGYTGSRTIAQLRALFDACFRIQLEASEAAGRHIPMVVENVKGAQPWVGRAQANYGSFYLWGDVRSVGGRIIAAHRVEFGAPGVKAMRGAKVQGLVHGRFPGGGLAQGHLDQVSGRKVDVRYASHGSWRSVAGEDWRSPQNVGRKVPGMNFHEHEKIGKPGRSFQSAAVDGMKAGTSHAWFNDHKRNGVELDSESRLSYTSSRSSARKAASAQIAKIPAELSAHIARCFKPASQEQVA